MSIWFNIELRMTSDKPLAVHLSDARTRNPRRDAGGRALFGPHPRNSRETLCPRPGGPTAAAPRATGGPGGGRAARGRPTRAGGSRAPPPALSVCSFVWLCCFASFDLPRGKKLPVLMCTLGWAAPKRPTVKVGYGAVATPVASLHERFSFFEARN